MSKRLKESGLLLTYADELVESLRAGLPLAVKYGEEKAIHQSRVATRRLHAAMDVFKPIAGGPYRKDFTKVLKKLRKNLGPMRDLDVMLGHLKEFGHHQSATDWLEPQLIAQQAGVRKHAAEEIDIAKGLARLGAWWGVREEWSNAGETLDGLLARSLHLQLESFTEHSDAISGRSHRETGGALLDPHQLRIAGKSLRYTLELAVASGHRLPAGVTRSFKKMQDALGQWHDYVVLNDRLLQLAIGCRDAPVVLSILEMAKNSIRKSQRQLAKFAHLWNRCGDSMAIAIRQSFPLLQQADDQILTEARMDLDPPDSAEFLEHHLDLPQDEPSAA